MLDDLFEACRRNDLERVQSLVAADPTLLTRQDPNGETPLLAALYRRQAAVVDWLATQQWDRTIHEAAAIDDVDRVATLLSAAPGNVSTHSPDGWTPLHLAAFFGADRVAALLLTHGADLQRLSRNAMANTPLHAALAARQLDLVHRLLAAGASPTQECAGYTPLALAEAGHFEAGADAVRRSMGGAS